MGVATIFADICPKDKFLYKGKIHKIAEVGA